MQCSALVSISDAAKILGIKPQTGRDWLWKNKFPVATVKINGKRLVPINLLNAYIDGLICASSNSVLSLNSSHTNQTLENQQ